MVVPYKNDEGSKKEQVKEMFDKIASRYDFMNHFLTAGIDTYWRKKVRKVVAEGVYSEIMDMAAGTGDLAIELVKLNPKSIVGIDISAKMLAVGQKKIQKRNLSDVIAFKVGDAESIEEKTEAFDVVTCGFGVRNFQDMQKGLSEFLRVLKTGGRVVILELSIPQNFLFRFGYNIYFQHILPLWGKLVSKDMSAYKYLPESVAKFPKRNEFLQILENVGFKDCKAKSLSLGIATIFVATK